MRVRSASAVVIVLLAALLYAVAPPESAVAQTTTANQGVVASMAVDPAAVRAAGHIPSRWKLKLDSHGKALLVVFMYDGTAIINGTSRPYPGSARPYTSTRRICRRAFIPPVTSKVSEPMSTCLIGRPAAGLSLVGFGLLGQDRRPSTCLR